MKIFSRYVYLCKISNTANSRKATGYKERSNTSGSINLNALCAVVLNISVAKTV